MRRLALALAAFSVAIAANAQIYQWKDESGKTVISDKPPVGSVTATKRIDSASAPSAIPAQKSAADRELEMRKRQKEAQDASEKAAKDQTVAADKAKNCESARRNLQALESGERIALRDDKGERYFMDDSQREQEITNTRQMLQSNCSN
ncbi:MAG: DUF4124 domain-containing protein [Propionivibrio sp.]